MTNSGRGSAESRLNSGAPARFSLSNLPIKHRLPLLIGALLFGTILIFIWASYRGMKESALEAGRERLHSLTHQLATMFQQSVANTATKTVTAANDPAVRQFLHSPLARSHAGALAALQPLAVPQDQGSWQVELWDANRSLSLAIPEGSSPLSQDLEIEFTKAAAGPPFSA